MRVVDTYSLQIVRDEGSYTRPPLPPPPESKLISWLRETEDNLTDLLPCGYSVRIKPWNEETTTDE